jgi:hypothetical protein
MDCARSSYYSDCTIGQCNCNAGMIDPAMEHMSEWCLVGECGK